MSTARDHESRTAEITDCDPTPPEILMAARLTVCGKSENSAEAILFMRMLGIHPDQEQDQLPHSQLQPHQPSPKTPHLPHTPPRILRQPPRLNTLSQTTKQPTIRSPRRPIKRPTTPLSGPSTTPPIAIPTPPNQSRSHDESI